MKKKDFKKMLRSRDHLSFSVGKVSYYGAGQVVNVECKRLLKDKKLQDRIFKLYNGGVK